MTHQVRITAEAEGDLLAIGRYVARHDGLERAEWLLAQLEETCVTLAAFPDRGHVPLELERVGMFDYCEVHWKPYRIVYQVAGRRYVHAVLDGRRSLQELLERRLLQR